MTKNKNSTERFKEILLRNNLNSDIIEFENLTRTSAEAANVIGCEIAQIAKTLIFKGKKSLQPICIIASGANKVDEKITEQILNEPIEKPNADFVLTNTDFVIGGVPPFGYQLNIKPLIDEDLLKFSEIWAAAGTPYSVFKISPKDLIRITQGQVLKIKK